MPGSCWGVRLKTTKGFCVAALTDYVLDPAEVCRAAEAFDPTPAEEDNRMPTRLIREGILDSKAVNSLSACGELFYRRLMSAVDDYGRFDADPTLLRARLFPRQMDRWSEDDIVAAIKECASAEISEGIPLVVLYGESGKQFLQLSNFGQRIQSQKSKFPSPDEEVERTASIGKIYFIQGAQSRRIKIGYTQWEPENRLKKLRTGSSETLTLLGFFAGKRKEETELHSKFSPYALVGEWFTCCDEILKEITNRCQPLPTVENSGKNFPPSRASRAQSETETNADTDSKSFSSSSPSPKNGSGTAHGSRFSLEIIPEEWAVWAERDCGWAAEKCRRIFDSFRDYWIATAGAKGRKADWLATWRNWCREDQRREAKQNGMLPFPPKRARNSDVLDAIIGDGEGG